MTPAQKQALQHLHHRGGEGAIDRHGSVVAGGVRLQFLADTWLRLMTTGHVEPRGPMRLGLTDLGREAAIRFRSEECEEVEIGDEPDPDCDCGACYGRGGYEATRVPEWDGRPEDSIGSGDWLARGSEALCDRCGYETNPEYGHNVAGKAVCDECMTLADWDIVNPERAAELRAEMAEDEASI